MERFEPRREPWVIHKPIDRAKTPKMSTNRVIKSRSMPHKFNLVKVLILTSEMRVDDLIKEHG